MDIDRKKTLLVAVAVEAVRYIVLCAHLVASISPGFSLFCCCYLFSAESCNHSWVCIFCAGRECATPLSTGADFRPLCRIAAGDVLLRGLLVRGRQHSQRRLQRRAHGPALHGLLRGHLLRHQQVTHPARREWPPRLCLFLLLAFSLCSFRLFAEFRCFGYSLLGSACFG